jgi:hypothetical protein
MSGGIYLLQSNGQLVKMDERRYDSEDLPFELPDGETMQVCPTVTKAQAMLKTKSDGFNIRVNEGQTAGQTIDYAHGMPRTVF